MLLCWRPVAPPHPTTLTSYLLPPTSYLLQWHFLILQLESSGSVKAWVDDELIGECSLPSEEKNISTLPSEEKNISTLPSEETEMRLPLPPAAPTICPPSIEPAAAGGSATDNDHDHRAADTGILLTAFYGGATEEWAAPADAYVDLGSFTLWEAVSKVKS